MIEHATTAENGCACSTLPGNPNANTAAIDIGICHRGTRCQVLWPVQGVIRRRTFCFRHKPFRLFFQTPVTGSPYYFQNFQEPKGWLPAARPPPPLAPYPSKATAPLHHCAARHSYRSCTEILHVAFGECLRLGLIPLAQKGCRK